MNLKINRPAIFLRRLCVYLLVAAFGLAEVYAADKLLAYDFNEGSGTLATNSGLIADADGTIINAQFCYG